MVKYRTFVLHFIMYQQHPFYPDEEEWEYPEEEIEYYDDGTYVVEEPEFVDSWEYPDGQAAPMPEMGVLITVAAILFIIFVFIRIGTTSWPSAQAASLTVETSPTPLVTLDPLAFAAPYDDYILTQGPHGASYGHQAIDITAGKGTVIKSPINGVVTALYVDGLGNTTLMIENDQFIITLLHGIYTVAVGDKIIIGQPIGTESNIGRTTDRYGVSCRGRDCGYHTHLNVFDKSLGISINPLPLLNNK